MRKITKDLRGVLESFLPFSTTAQAGTLAPAWGILIDEFVVPPYMLPYEHRVSAYAKGMYIFEMTINNQRYVERVVVQ
jgi:hypothetical protein